MCHEEASLEDCGGITKNEIHVAIAAKLFVNLGVKFILVTLERATVHDRSVWAAAKWH
jgi:hypothetical protein